MGIKRLLQDVQGLKVVGEAGTGEEAVLLAKEFVPDVVIMDVHMPGIGGMEATRKMIRHNPDIKVLALTIYDDNRIPPVYYRLVLQGTSPRVVIQMK